MKARTWLLSSVATVAMAFNASAADMAIKAPVYVAPFSWTGFYLGASAGAIGLSSENTYSTSAPGVPANSDTNRGSGVLAGGTVGYNFQTGQWVLEPGRAPYLSDAQVNIFCRCANAFPIQTHTVFVGQVCEVRHLPRTAPLLYLDGAYSSVAVRIS